MYRYAIEHDFLIVEYFDVYEGAELYESILEILSTLLKHHLSSLKNIIFDLSEVESIGLHDSDRAYVAIWRVKLNKIFLRYDLDAQKIISRVNAVVVLPKDSEVSAIYQERLKKMSPAGGVVLPTKTFATLTEAVSHLGLDAEWVKRSHRYAAGSIIREAN